MSNAVKQKKSSFISKGKLDISFLSFVLILLTVGLVMLFSASYAYSYAYFDNSYKFILRQSIFAVIGVGIMMGISKIDYHFWKKFSWMVFFASIIMLGILLILPPMATDLDVKRWLAIGSFSFQPSEIAKFAIILLFSSLISANYKHMKSFKFIAFLIILLGLTCVLVVLEPHLSATVLIFAIGVVLMVVGGLQLRYIVAGGFSAIGLFVAAITIVGYSSDRIKYWLDPWADASGSGFQTIQSLLAIGSGGILGRGIGQSRQKYLWVPEPHNDFIFSIVCEELGLIGALVIILLFCLLVWRGFTIAMRSPDRFGALLTIGLVFQIGLQAMLNIWVVTNTIPNTGISLPFFSYGGTSLLILLAEMGIVLSVSRQANLEK
ncbi:MAG: putative lipid II flippase FtsW [Clostridia bacterium]|nr:putative lipid II flippase FtsW [Clostridia bacterium]MBQ2236994.1 putative lipid II flippase FtsW [Clostridia bacterium]MEE1185098.1 putative lipid II flippase FtsW [Acutalibacteraceae bacterium]